MAKFDLFQIKPIPGFDSEKWQEQRHVEMHRENQGMTAEQIRKREMLASDPMRRERAQYWEEQAKAEATGK